MLTLSQGPRSGLSSQETQGGFELPIHSQRPQPRSSPAGPQHTEAHLTFLLNPRTDSVSSKTWSHRAAQAPCSAHSFSTLLLGHQMFLDANSQSRHPGPCWPGFLRVVGQDYLGTPGWELLFSADCFLLVPRVSFGKALRVAEKLRPLPSVCAHVSVSWRPVQVQHGHLLWSGGLKRLPEASPWPARATNEITAGFRDCGNHSGLGMDPSAFAG